MTRSQLGLGLVVAAVLACGACAEDNGLAATGQRLTMCGQTVALSSGLGVFDYSGTFGNQVPEGQDVLFVRTRAVGVAPPDHFAELFTTVPSELVAVVDTSSYSAWRTTVLNETASRLDEQRVRFDPVAWGDCTVQTTLAPVLPDHDRPDDWSVIFTVTGNGSQAT